MPQEHTSRFQLLSPQRPQQWVLSPELLSLNRRQQHPAKHTVGPLLPWQEQEQKSPSTPLPCCFPGLDLNKTHVLSLPHALDCFEVKHPGAVPLSPRTYHSDSSEPGIKALVLTHFVNLASASVPVNTNSKGAAGSCLQGSPACCTPRPAAHAGRGLTLAALSACPYNVGPAHPGVHGVPPCRN